MKKGFVITVVAMALIGLVWCGWQIHKSTPEDRPYVPKQGEVIGQSDNARGASQEKTKQQESNPSQSTKLIIIVNR